MAIETDRSLRFAISWAGSEGRAARGATRRPRRNEQDGSGHGTHSGFDDSAGISGYIRLLAAGMARHELFAARFGSLPALCPVPDHGSDTLAARRGKASS